jgi:predicted nucleotidyltransferase
MYEKVNITENHLRILALFTRGYDKEYYIREVQKLLGLSPRTAYLILEDLEQKTILASSMKGKIKTYRLKNNVTSRNYLVFVEQYKALAFLKSSDKLREIIDKISPLVKGVGVVFGSYAKGAQKKDSDLDIFVAGECDLESISRISAMYGIEISVKKYPLKAFKDKMRTDIFLKEVMDAHIIFKEAEKFANMVMNYGKD